MKWVLALALTGCASTNSLCPVGARPVTEGSPIKRAQYCTNIASTLQHVPAPGRTYNVTVGAPMPAQLGGGVEGPFTSWHGNGKPASHGDYVARGSRSEPDGVWGFWWPSGKRWALGRFHDGQPVGCFAYWDEAGTRSTGTVSAGVLHEAACVPPSEETFAAMEGTLAAMSPTGTWADLTLAFGAGGAR